MSRVQQFTKQPVLFAPPAKQPHPASPLRRLARRLSRVFMGALGVTILSSAALVAQAGEVPLSQDAEVRATSPDSLYGGRNSLAVRQAQLQQSLLQFDLAGYTGPVLNATLTLPITSVSREGSFEVRRLLSDWDEGTVNFNNRPAISSQLEASQAVIASDANRPLSIDVTAMVQALIDDPANDYGFALVPAGNIYIKTRSGETASGPTLSIEVEGPPPADPLVIETVFVGEDNLAIAGQNFDNGDPPSVSLSGVGVLALTEFNESMISVSFPAGALVDGDYLLTVSTGSEPGQTGTYNLTVGAVGNQGPPGPQGPQGDTGAQGPAGPTGPIGPEGSAGATGSQGPAGPIGPEGSAGATGAQGPVGPIGPEGSAGATGSQGPAGPAGPIGPEGSVGVTGAQGPVGPIGPEGSAGATGSQGPRGPEGSVGPQGSIGPMGPPGVTGAQGPEGAPGPVGPTGPEGAVGATGPQGASGLSGHQVTQNCFLTNPLAPGEKEARIASCPVGKLILGGGGLVNGQNPLYLQNSHPNGNNGWRIDYVNGGSVTVSSQTACVYTICANVN